MPYRRALCLTALLVLLPASGSAQATLISGLGGPAGYGTQCLGMNDDGSSNAIDLAAFFPAGLRFFDTTHSTAFVNTNGNISLTGPVPTYTAVAFPVAAQPMIAPYWADVDIRTFDRVAGFMRRCNGPRDGDTTMGAACHNPSENGVWWHLEAGRMIVTWDRVSYFQCHGDDDQRMNFQLIITAHAEDAANPVYAGAEFFGGAGRAAVAGAPQEGPGGHEDESENPRSAPEAEGGQGAPAARVDGGDRGGRADVLLQRGDG